MASLEDEFDKEIDLNASFDNEEEVPEQEPEAAEPEISQLGSGFGGLKTGTLFGLRDEVAGLAGAAGHGFGDIMSGKLPELEALKETYREAKQGELELAAAEQAANPKTYLAGELGSMALTPATGVAQIAKLGKLQKLEKSFKTAKGIKALDKLKKAEKLKLAGKIGGTGAVTGLGLSKADLTEGDPDQIKQALMDTAYGTVTALGAHKAIEKVGKGFKKLVDTPAMRKSAEKNILGAFRPPKKILGKELLSGEKDQYKGVGRALLGKVRDPDTGKNVPLSQFVSDPEKMSERISMALQQNRDRIQKPFDLAQERLDQKIQMLQLSDLKKGYKDGALINEIYTDTLKRVMKLKKGYGGEEASKRIGQNALEFVEQNKDILKSYNLGALTDLKSKLGKQISSSEWAKKIQDGSLKSEDKEMITGLYKIIKNRVEDLAESVSKKGENLGVDIKKFNQEYSNLLDAKLVSEFDLVRAAKGPSLSHKDFILPALVGMGSSGAGGVVAAGTMYIVEKNTGRKIGDLAQIASAKGLDTLATKIDAAKTTKAYALAKKVRDLTVKPFAERVGFLSQILADNEELTGYKVHENRDQKQFNKLLGRPSNITNATDEQLTDIHQQLRDKFGDDNVRVKQLSDIINSEDKKFKGRRKFILSSSPDFREMVDALQPESEDVK